MNILHVSASPRGHASESNGLARKVIEHLLIRHPASTVINRLVAGNTLSPVDEPYATSQQSAVDVSPDGSMAQSEALIQELEAADIVVIATPMHNYTVPAALKLWLDHIARVRRTFDISAQGKVGLLQDRPVFLAIASGGRFSGERAHQPDFLTPYLKTLLAMIGLHDVTIFSVQGTASRPETLAETRRQTDLALHDYFAT